MKYLYNMFFVLLITNLSYAQSSSSKADDLRRKGSLEEALKEYKSEYLISPDNRRNTYDLACTYSLLYQKDSAFQYLNIALNGDNSLWVLTDSDLFSLIDDPRWLDIERNQIIKFQEDEGVLKQPEYTQKLLNLILKDQALDYYIDQAKIHFMKEGEIPHWYYPMGAFKQEIVQENYAEMQQLLLVYGWPKYSSVGNIAADAPLLIINHHESDSVRVKYLSMIKQSCLDGEGSCLEYAKIQDRILVSNEELQIYGMQFRYNSKRELEPFPVYDPDNVDKRRAEIGLEPLSIYLKRKIGFDWKVE